VNKRRKIRLLCKEVDSFSSLQLRKGSDFGDFSSGFEGGELAERDGSGERLVSGISGSQNIELTLRNRSVDNEEVQ
jgi:hypothetical protein